VGDAWTDPRLSAPAAPHIPAATAGSESYVPEREKVALWPAPFLHWSAPPHPLTKSFPHSGFLLGFWPRIVVPPPHRPFGIATLSPPPPPPPLFSPSNLTLPHLTGRLT
jgi:hypothetical protein